IEPGQSRRIRQRRRQRRHGVVDADRRRRGLLRLHLHAGEGGGEGDDDRKQAHGGSPVGDPTSIATPPGGGDGHRSRFAGGGRCSLGDPRRHSTTWIFSRNPKTGPAGASPPSTASAAGSAAGCTRRGATTSTRRGWCSGASWNTPAATSPASRSTA